MLLAQIVQEAIQAERCPIHNNYAIVGIAGHELQIGCCCARFQTKCIKKTKGLLREVGAVGFKVRGRTGI